MTREPHAAGASRRFYEDLAGRALDPHTRRGILYRNHVVARTLPVSGARVLEIGPGEGWLTRILNESGHRVVALDLARGWLARLDAPAGKVAGEMTALPFADRTFDAVVAAEVIEHIPDLERALAEAARILRPGGTLVVTVPYRETLHYVNCPECGARFEVNGHVHRFEGGELAHALEACGLHPGTRFVGSSRLARELLRRLPLSPFLPAIMLVDRLTHQSQRVTDTWLLMTARRPA
ncbi:MAG TPA: class I SAM-dependent methyltransferase [Candidatus Eisenbacteria bacterium]|nr:class I SAM-dependent methyltransferase [Candidatus Eisenbacteria bacterium]